MSTEIRKRRTIQLHDQTYQKLKRMGIYGESMDDIIKRLMFKEKEKNKGKKASYEDVL